MNQPTRPRSTEEETEQQEGWRLALADVVLTAQTSTGLGAVGMLSEGCS
jgi:hypothetical protein